MIHFLYALLAGLLVFWVQAVPVPQSGLVVRDVLSANVSSLVPNVEPTDRILKARSGIPLDLLKGILKPSTELHNNLKLIQPIKPLLILKPTKPLNIVKKPKPGAGGSSADAGPSTQNTK